MGNATWNGTGDWVTNASDWSGGTGTGGVPGYQNILVNSGVLSLAATETVGPQSITIGGGTGSASLNVSGTIKNIDGFTISTNGTVNVYNGGTLTSYAAVTTAAGTTFYVNGTAGGSGPTTIGGSLNVDTKGAFTASTLEISSGATASVTGSVITSGNTTVDGSVTVNSAGTFNVGQLLTIDNTGHFTVNGSVTVSSGITVSGVLTVNTGSNVTDGSGLVVNAGSTVNIYGTFIPGSTGLSGSGTVTVSGGTLGSSANALNATGTNNIVITNGATVYMNNANPPGSISFGSGNGNTLILTNYVTTISTPITNFGTGDTIQFLGDQTTFTGITATAGTVSGTYTLTLNNQYNPITLTDVTFSSSITSQITANGNGTYNVPGVTDSQVSSDPGYYQLGGCFLTGTKIATPSGPVAVEALQAGDLVSISVDGHLAAKPVKWIGYRHVKPGDLAGDDAHPVRIKANAFADGIPARDLLMTNEHCVRAGGGLIPVRLLVNGSSIISDISISSFTYYHVELEEHGILLAEGLQVESYLDTGNRGNFANAPVPCLHPQLTVNIRAYHEAQPAAPLLVSPDAVKPVWDMLNSRASALGLRRAAEPVLTYDADLHLLTAAGTVIRPLRLTEGKAWFVLPAASGNVRLMSRTARPCDTIAPYLDDRRELGVSVGEMVLHAGTQTILIAAHLYAPDLAGWHAPEGLTHRWTHGSAELPLPAVALTAPAILEIEILQAGPYKEQAPTSNRLAA